VAEALLRESRKQKNRLDRRLNAMVISLLLPSSLHAGC
jgi:hypothetical protein